MASSWWWHRVFWYVGSNVLPTSRWKPEYRCHVVQDSRIVRRFTITSHVPLINPLLPALFASQWKPPTCDAVNRKPAHPQCYYPGSNRAVTTFPVHHSPITINQSKLTLRACESSYKYNE
jgi:hypothetical protein